METVFLRYRTGFNSMQIVSQANYLTNMRDANGIEKRLTEHMQKEKQDQRKTPLLSPLTNRGKTNRTKSKTPTATSKGIRSWSFTFRSCSGVSLSSEPNESTGQLYNQGLPCSGYPMSPRRGMVPARLLGFNPNHKRGSRPGVQAGRPVCLCLGIA